MFIFLTDNWNNSEYSDLMTELKLLIHIGQHKNIVNILGVCTKGDSNLLCTRIDSDVKYYLSCRKIFHPQQNLQIPQNANSSVTLSLLLLSSFMHTNDIV